MRRGEDLTTDAPPRGLGAPRRARLAGAALRAVPVLTVLIGALWAFASGVGTTERPGLPDATPLTHVYYALGLFVLGGMDLGVPEGGPAAARAVLWFAYFLGPAVTTSAVAEGALRLLRPDALRRLALRDHVVLVGLGRHGSRYLDAIRATDPERPVLVVERDPARRVALTGGRAERTVFLTGDVDEPAVRRALLADRAAGVVLTTQRDLVNLEVAFELADAHPHLRVAALVADAALHRGAAPVSGQGGPILFNAHRIAAEHLYRTALHAHFRHTHGGDAVVIAGFGRFGQAFLEFLQDEAGGELASVVLVDLHAAQHAGAFADRVGFTPPCAPVALDGDVADPRTWDAVEAALQRAGHPPVRLLCTERDDVNLQAAMLLRARGVTDRLFARVEHDTAFVRRLAAHHGFELLAVDATLTLALRERHRAWFLDGGP